MVELHTYDELSQLAQKILSEAKNQGADAAQALVFSNENIATRYGEKHITQNTQRNSIGFTLQVKLGNKVGNYSGSGTTDDKLKGMISDAITLAKFSPDDPEFPGFVQEQPDYPDLNRKIIDMTPMDLSEHIKIAVDTANELNSTITAVAGNLNFNANRSILQNSYDVEARSESSSISGIINVAATVGDNESRSTSSVAGITFADLKIAETAESVAERAYRGLNQNELDVGSYTAILGREAVMELMFHIGLAASSSMLINHQSPFMDKLGEQIFDERITITDAVLDPDHYASQNFDFDGEPSRDITYIEDGILKEFAYNRRNAMKLGVETNGRGVGGFALFRSPSFTPGLKDEEGLIESVDDGVYVTNLWYSNFVNMPDGSVTGLTKDGLFKIENGEIVGSLRNMRFTDTLFSMFGSAEPGNNIKQQLHSTYGTLFGLAGKIPSVKLDSFNFSSKGKH